MNPLWWILIGIVVFLLMFGMYFVRIYNKLVQLRNRFKNAYSQIDVQLKRRYDLIPNLVETAKGYMKHESETLEAVIQARNQAMSAGQAAAQSPGDPTAMQGIVGAETALTGTLGKLFALAESYPDLKANENMLSIQEELSSTENRIAFARQSYNDSVMHFNTRRESFPDTMIANTFNFTEAMLWEIEAEEERENVKVSFT
ncbi:MAG: LemA family protein [Planctomycetes bacterium]|nr:LemA family protein [Planctomycetota bacterium]